jgi:two-component system, NarL family, response regulator NreC
VVRILIADDTPQIRSFIRKALEEHAGWEVCGEASHGLEAVSMAAELNPDLVILDLTMPRINGMQAASTIHTATPKLPLLLFTQHLIDAFLEPEARNAGFSGGISKGSYELLVTAVEALLRGESFFSFGAIPELEISERKNDGGEADKPGDPGKGVS